MTADQLQRNAVIWAEGHSWNHCPQVLASLAAAYVAGGSAFVAPDDDGESITAEWLEVVGFMKLAPVASWDKQDDEWAIQGEHLALSYFPQGEEDERWYWRYDVKGDGWELPNMTTRGQVRQLCEVFDIELKEKE